MAEVRGLVIECQRLTPDCQVQTRFKPGPVQFITSFTEVVESCGEDGETVGGRGEGNKSWMEQERERGMGLEGGWDKQNEKIDDGWGRWQEKEGGW